MNLEDVAGALSLRIRRVVSTGFDGAQFPAEGQPGGLVVVNKRIGGVGRQRFTIAHEIGHYVLQNHGSRGPCRKQDIKAWQEDGRKEEEAANRFASELLLPAEQVGRIVCDRGSSMATAKFIRDEFKTSLTAAAFRCVELGESESVLVRTVNGVVESFLPSKTWRYFVNVKSTLGSGTLAIRLSEARGVTEIKGVVSGLAWCSGHMYMELGAEVLEDSILLGGHNTILSILTAM